MKNHHNSKESHLEDFLLPTVLAFLKVGWYVVHQDSSFIGAMFMPSLSCASDHDQAWDLQMCETATPKDGGSKENYSDQLFSAK